MFNSFLGYDSSIDTKQIPGLLPAKFIYKDFKMSFSEFGRSPLENIAFNGFDKNVKIMSPTKY